MPPETPAEVQQAKMRFGIIGNAPALTAAISRAVQVAPIDLSVLVTGESGSGKEFFPKIIHAFSARKHARYIAVNCGAIPEGTIDSELFGHEKGAFTGAIGSRKGYFEEADGGTIFLDEVAELPLTTQARLLRVLESGEFIKVGSSTVQKTNIRVVAATNVDMLKAVEEGRFREDLYYRLSTVNIAVPPLRDRGNDIMLLARKFASDFGERYRMPPVTFSDEARGLMMRYRWPGNVRQLKNVVEQTALFDAGREVTADDIEQYLPAGGPVYTPVIASAPSHTYDREREAIFNMIFRMQKEIDALRAEIEKRPAPAQQIATPASEVREMPMSLVHYHHPAAHTSTVEDITADDITAAGSAATPQPSLTLEDTERETIRRSLENNGGRRKATARELNISERTLYRKIKEYGLE
ncbi:sigma-54 dependent transcriptional regulator [Paramuribaculum intestinale]|uniref:Sigma-54-dependent Fis family transcriptional regulator n=1 Tax=Paramuribaculum intestinale TaxID=2094151 RepID=A0A2V1IXH6_9BACT|nr:sigma-54 dependent transcriptional regulator [Paramuribaculum intestinale]MBJ2186729.1 sigma-54-dependent Fis family transcriptional regulator [Muribaculaceae bacterium]ROS93494.1 sigma-54-dependent Fis family transcriptional regulator [Muribaculaceae bacterium Isolate-043 (Harlan)]MCX4330419.1 sigma-54 dependent transcriptional regulator [Paramuribaculum intestinale]PWB07786.1 sigma-54-dependent Fis family transcriptional regulator [Paramuribaculum intestinale]PWB11708.1 sigma-54-dependent